MSNPRLTELSPLDSERNNGNLADRVRGGEVLRAAQSSPGDSGSPGLAPVAPPALSRPIFGHNSELPRGDVDRAVLKHLGEIGRARGMGMPSDVELVQRGRVYFYDEQGKVVSISKVHITWDEP